VSTVLRASNQKSPVNVRKLTYVYRTATEELVALRDFNLRLADAERMVAIVGPSGSGKTTLLNILAALHKPTAGAIWVDGRNLATLSDKDRDEYRRRHVGYAWQRAELSTWPQLTVFENVLVPMAGKFASPLQRRYHVAVLLEAVGLDRYYRRLPTELGYGDVRRLGLAVALANSPRLLLADEVTAGLDDEAADQLLADLSGLLKALDARAIIVAHGRHLPRHVDRIVPLPYPRPVVPPSWAGREHQRSRSKGLIGGTNVSNDVLLAESVSRVLPAPEGSQWVIRNASLRVREGEMVAILGPSGSGKSTLLALCGGLDEPDVGRIAIAGQTVTRLSGPGRERLLQRRVGWILDRAPPLHITPVESISLAARIAGSSRREAERVARLALAATGLQDRADTPVGRLSGGEQIRVAVARALARAPALVIADEPTAQLDIITSMDIIELLREAADSGTAVLMATQYPVLAEVADRVLVMSEGTIREVRRR
jgi:ABC-type lipoprotein export system ATPase subunit